MGTFGERPHFYLKKKRNFLGGGLFCWVGEVKKIKKYFCGGESFISFLGEISLKGGGGWLKIVVNLPMTF